MNIEPGRFANSHVRQNQNQRTKNVYREFIFDDIEVKGAFLFSEMKLELSEAGNWSFYITAEGINSTTILRNGRKSGPNVTVVFKDAEGRIGDEVALGQVNYDSRDESANTYLCRGNIEHPELVDSVEIRYDAFFDFSCRSN